MSVNLTIAGAHERTVKGHVDKYYGGDNDEAYADLATAYATIPVGLRPGKTFGVYVSGTIVEYWWPNATATANGQEVLKNSVASGGLGNWLAVPGQSASIINQNIDFEYNNCTNVIFVRGQFSLANTFTGTTITLGQLPAGNYPKTLLQKLIVINGVYVFVGIDTIGNITLTSRDGFNLPTVADTTEQYTIETFYKPIVTSTISISNASSVSITIYYSGSVSGSATVAAGNTDTITVPNGTYAFNGRATGVGAYISVNGTATYVPGGPAPVALPNGTTPVNITAHD